MEIEFVLTVEVPDNKDFDEETVCDNMLSDMVEVVTKANLRLEELYWRRLDV